MSRSLQDLYYADFRVRLCIIDHLEFIARRSLDTVVQHVSPAKAALQLALCCTLGFGDAEDTEVAIRLMVKNSLTVDDLRSHVVSISQSMGESLDANTLYSRLESQGYIESIDFVQYYRERQLLDRALDQYSRELESIKECFGEENGLYLRLAYRLALISEAQGRKAEAKALFEQLAEAGSRKMGKEHPFTLINMANIATVLHDQEQFQEAEALMEQVVDIETRIHGETHLYTLKSMNELACLYRDQRQWERAEKLLSQIIENSSRVYSEEHYLTSLSKGHLIISLIDQERWNDAEELEKQTIGIVERASGIEHPFTLERKLSLATIYMRQGRSQEAEDLFVQTIATSKRVLGDEHDLTQTAIHQLACVNEAREQ